MKRKDKLKVIVIIVIVALAVISAILVFASKKSQVQGYGYENKRIAIELIDSGFYVLYDKKTKVEYLYITDDVGSVTPLYNKDGSLSIYKGGK